MKKAFRNHAPSSFIQKPIREKGHEVERQEISQHIRERKQTSRLLGRVFKSEADKGAEVENRRDRKQRGGSESAFRSGPKETPHEVLRAPRSLGEEIHARSQNRYVGKKGIKAFSGSGGPDLRDRKESNKTPLKEILLRKKKQIQRLVG